MTAGRAPARAESPLKGRASDRFLAALSGAHSVTFISHVNPDPDSIGSMMGLAHLVRRRMRIPTVLTKDGLIERAENRVLIDALRLDLVPVDQVLWCEATAVVMVDSQPGTGRHTIPSHVPIRAVIDHHETQGDVTGVEFVDVREDLGATCTMVTEYLLEQRQPLPARLATALFYGIETEITGYPREAGPRDDAAMQFLFPHANKDLLAKIRNARLPRAYFRTLLQALQEAKLYGDVIVSWAGELPDSGLVAEIADLLIRYQRAHWAISIGLHNGMLVFSLRSTNPRAHAGRRLHTVVGDRGRAGGHGRRAGGFIRLDQTTPQAIAAARELLQQRLLQELGVRDHEGEPLATE